MTQAYLKRNIKKNAFSSDNCMQPVKQSLSPNCSKIASVPKPTIKKQKLNGAENMARVQIHLWKAR